MQLKLALAVQEALRGSCQVTIAFKEGVPDRTIVRGIFYLFGMVEVGAILLSKEDQLALRVFLRSRKWERAGGNHPRLLTLTSKFDKIWFVKHMHHALQEIEVVASDKIEVVVGDTFAIAHDEQIEAANN